MIRFSPATLIALALLSVIAIAFVSGYVAGYWRRSLISRRRRRHESERERDHGDHGVRRRHH
jgi:hypothetical protein